MFHETGPHVLAVASQSKYALLMNLVPARNHPFQLVTELKQSIEEKEGDITKELLLLAFQMVHTESIMMMVTETMVCLPILLGYSC